MDRSFADSVMSSWSSGSTLSTIVVNSVSDSRYFLTEEAQKSNWQSRKMSWKFSLEYINCALIKSWIGDKWLRHSWIIAGKRAGEFLHNCFIHIINLPVGSLMFWFIAPILWPWNFAVIWCVLYVTDLFAPVTLWGFFVCFYKYCTYLGYVSCCQ